MKAIFNILIALIISEHLVSCGDKKNEVLITENRILVKEKKLLEAMVFYPDSIKGLLSKTDYILSNEVLAIGTDTVLENIYINGFKAFHSELNIASVFVEKNGSGYERLININYYFQDSIKGDIDFSFRYIGDSSIFQGYRLTKDLFHTEDPWRKLVFR